MSSVKSVQPNDCSLRITSPAIPAGTAQSNYIATLSASGGIPPYTWAIIDGQLPSGLALNPTSGGIEGIPTAAGSFPFTTSVRDSKNAFVATGLSLNIVNFTPGPVVPPALIGPPAPAKPPAPVAPPVPVTPPPSTTTPPPVTAQPPVKVSPAPPVLAITSPSNGSKVFGTTVHVTATASDPQSPVTTVQFFLGDSPLGAPLSAGPFEVTWDTTQVADGPQNLSAVATDAQGGTKTQTVAVTVSNTSWNPAVLGVSWASDFVALAANEINVKTDSRLKVKAAGDGVTDDTGAIRAAVNLAVSSGGGVVYFPRGDYKIVTPSDPVSGKPLVVPSRVILRGASSTASRIFVNDPRAAYQTNSTATWGGLNFQSTSVSGMTDLGVYAVNSSTSPCALMWNWGTTKAKELFFNNLDVHLENCRSFWIESTDELLIQNSRFDSNAVQNGPIYVTWNSNLTFVNNTITYNFGRVQLHNSTDLLMQGNKITRDALDKDAENHSAIESGGVELSFGQNLQVLNNSIQTVNAPSSESADGEAIMTQESNVQNVLDAGSATGVTLTTLTDSNARWGSVTSSRLATSSPVVAMLTGPAAGQWRSITSINTGNKTLTLNTPWSPVPETGDLYSVFSWTLMNATIQGNTLTNNPGGIVLWEGCNNCTVQGNVLTNSRGILLRTADTTPDPSLYPESRRIHYVAINSKILKNTVSNTSGVRPAYIVLDTEAFSPDSYSGMGMLNIQVGGNTVNPFPANPNQSYDPGKNELPQDGFFPCFLFGPAASKPPVSTVFQGINFWNNSQPASVNYSSSYQQFATQACVTPSAP